MGIFDDLIEAAENTASVFVGKDSLIDQAFGLFERGENLITDGTFETDAQIDEKKRNAKILANASRNKTLFNEIMQDQTISEVTRGELLKRFDTLGVLDDGAFSSISGTFSQAKEGIGSKFKARQATEEFLQITRDKPGQKQTRFVDSVSNLGV